MFDKISENLKTSFTDPKTLVFMAIDFVLLSLVFYAVFAFLKKNRAARLIKYVVIISVLAVVLSSELLGLPVIGRIIGYIVLLAGLCIALMFPQELRRGLWKLASHKDNKATFTTDFGCSDEELNETIEDIVRATQNMAKKNVGALIVIATGEVPGHILESGTALDRKSVV